MEAGTRWPPAHPALLGAGVVAAGKVQWLDCSDGPKLLLLSTAVTHQLGAFSLALSPWHTQLHSGTPVRGEGSPLVGAGAGQLRLKGVVLSLAVVPGRQLSSCNYGFPRGLWLGGGGRPPRLTRRKVGEAPSPLQGWGELFLEGSACLGRGVGRGGRKRRRRMRSL